MANYIRSIKEIMESEVLTEEIYPNTIYICKDSHNIYYDTSDDQRVALRDNIVVLTKDADRVNNLFPKYNKIYVVMETKSAWIYIAGTWVKLNTNNKIEEAIKNIFKRLFTLEKKFNNKINIISKRNGAINLIAGETYKITMNNDIFFKLPEMPEGSNVAPEIKVFISRNKGKISFGTAFKTECLLTSGGYSYLNYNDLIVTFKWIPTNCIWAYDIQGIRR